MILRRYFFSPSRKGLKKKKILGFPLLLSFYTLFCHRIFFDSGMSFSKRKFFALLVVCLTFWIQQAAAHSDASQEALQTAPVELSALSRDQEFYEQPNATELVSLASSKEISPTSRVSFTAKHSFRTQNVKRSLINMFKTPYIDSVIDYETCSLFDLILYLVWNELRNNMWGGTLLLLLHGIGQLYFEEFYLSYQFKDIFRSITEYALFSLVKGFYNQYSAVLLLFYQQITFTKHIRTYKRLRGPFQKLIRALLDCWNMFRLCAQGYFQDFWALSSMLASLVFFIDSTLLCITYAFFLDYSPPYFLTF